MYIRKHHHACVYVGNNATKLLIDPGTLGPAPALDGVDAILISHIHYDHFDEKFVLKALDAGVPVWAPADVCQALGHRDGVAEAAAGESITLNSLRVEFAGDTHAEMHPQRRGVPNRAFMIREDDGPGGVFVTGDELAIPPSEYDALVTPVNAPWLRVTDMIRYVQQVRPTHFLGVHDGLVNDAGRKVAKFAVSQLVNEGADNARILKDGETFTLG